MVGGSLKTEREIQLMIEGGRKLSEIRNLLISQTKPGIKTIELNQLGEKEILKVGGKPSFKTVKGYKHAICVSINEEVVHGIPGKKKIKEGDVVGIDVGMIYGGLHTDTAWTIQVKSEKFNPSTSLRTRVQSETEKFLKVGEETLAKAIEVAKVGNRIGHISKIIEENIKKAGYSPVKVLTGHGVGKSLHEEPAIPQVFLGKVEDTPKIVPGMTLAIEVIYNLGTAEVFMKRDGWTIATQDGKISATFERTIAVSNNGVIILTP